MMQGRYLESPPPRRPFSVRSNTFQSGQVAQGWAALLWLQNAKGRFSLVANSHLFVWPLQSCRGFSVAMAAWLKAGRPLWVTLPWALFSSERPSHPSNIDGCTRGRKNAPCLLCVSHNATHFGPSVAWTFSGLKKRKHRSMTMSSFNGQ